MHVLFATAELAPWVKVGGLGEAACGLVRALRDAGVRVDVVVPDYGPGEAERRHRPGPAAVLSLPSWAGPASVRTFELDGLGPVHAVSVAGMARHHPYVHVATGEGWSDNDRRFFAFSQAVAALAGVLRPDVVHLNDWHTATALAALDPGLPSVFTIHNLAYQGWADRRWLGALGPRAAAFEHRGDCNPMAGAIRLADAVVAVSPTYATEIQRPETGEGLHPLTTEHAARIVGIRNGIDTVRWDPATDPLLPVPYSAADPRGRAHSAGALRRLAGFVDGLEEGPGDGHAGGYAGGTPVIGLVARMAAQKGVDVAVALAPLLESLPARMVIVGDGDPALVARARQAAEAHPGRVSYLPFDERTAHLVAAGADVMLVPSRFEPCGLTQMEAMAYGAVPVVSGVGGLRDTVLDDDRHPGRGTGFVADVADPAHLVDALHRALRARGDERRWQAIRHRGMTADWSWRSPADAYAGLYRSVASGACSPAPAASNESISLVDQPISLNTSEVCSPTRGANRNSPLGDRSRVAVSLT